MKNLAKEIALFLAFAIMLIAFSIAIKAVGLTFDQFIDGEVGYRTMGFMIISAIAVGGAGMKVFGWLHEFVAKTRGMKALAKHMEKYEEKSRVEFKTLQDAVASAENTSRQATRNFESVFKQLQETLKINQELIGANNDLADLAASRLTNIQQLVEQIKEQDRVAPLR